MSLTKLILIAALAIWLIPTGESQQRDLRDRAVATVEWATTFCDRNQVTCEKAVEGWTVFKQKAVFTATVVGTAIWQFIVTEANENFRRIATTSDTLTTMDREPQWRGQY